MKTEAYKLKYFEDFCQMSSRSVLIILSYTVSKVVFFETQCIVFMEMKLSL